MPQRALLHLPRIGRCRRSVLRHLSGAAFTCLRERELFSTQNGSWNLTDAGLEAAREILARHRGWQDFLLARTGLAPDHARASAHRLEYFGAQAQLRLDRDPPAGTVRPCPRRMTSGTRPRTDRPSSLTSWSHASSVDLPGSLEPSTPCCPGCRANSGWHMSARTFREPNWPPGATRTVSAAWASGGQSGCGTTAGRSSGMCGETTNFCWRSSCVTFSGGPFACSSPRRRSDAIRCCLGFSSREPTP
ncbi:MAG: hypothetical protein FJ270_09870 [Planctomycetes bacterium]|nr:hypothetical protein [Planctomycetota bacterium]